MSDADQIEKLRQRVKGWSLNDDSAWIKVKAGELRAALRAIDTKKADAPPAALKPL